MTPPTPLPPTAQALCEGWDHRPRWVVLDTCFSDGKVFAQVVQHLNWSPCAPKRLHYVGILSVAEAEAASLPAGLPAGLASSAVPPLLPGFQRFIWDAGRVTLTLCVGETGAMLRELQMAADVIRTHELNPDIWRLKALTRLCARGAMVWFPAEGAPSAKLMTEAGLEPSDEGSKPPGSLLKACFNPRWPLKKRPAAARDRPDAKHAVVVGAGLAGAAVAHALALRGWAVSVVDAHPEPASEASGLPAGLLVPHVSSDDSPRSRLSRAGVRLMLQHLESHLEAGQDWSLTGALERNVELSPGYTVRGWEQPGDRASGLWHPWAAWVKPRAMVRAWLQHPAISFTGGFKVTRLCRDGPQWKVHSDQIEIAPADAVVLCNANGTTNLLQSLAREGGALTPAPEVLEKMAALQRLYGTLSFGPMPPENPAMFPPHPVNGSGSFIPRVPEAASADRSTDDPAPAQYWFAGSTFETDPATQQDIAAQHQANHHKLAALLPDVAGALETAFSAAQHWQSSRCVSHDRMPLVGRLTDTDSPELWISAAMGARGLSFAALCAELLVARMEGEPLPIEAGLAKLLDVQRPRRGRVALPRESE